VYPIVRDRAAWQEYSVKEQGWREQSLKFQNDFPNALLTSDSGSETGHRNQGYGHQYLDNVQNISEYVYKVVDGVPSKLAHVEIMLPVWQHAPVHNTLPMVNYDVLNSVSKDTLQEVLQTNKAVIGHIFDIATSSHG